MTKIHSLRTKPGSASGADLVLVRSIHRVILFLLISTHSMGAATPDISPTSRVLALSAPRPDYPSEARRQHLEGVGRYLMIIDTDTGLVTSVRVIRSSGYGILDR